MKINELKDNQGARKSRTRIGRGPGSGKGSTGGRGGKGQTARTGKAIKGFEGGQMPLHRRMPKSGFTNYTTKEFAVITLDDLQEAISSKKVAANEISADTLKKAQLITRIGDGLRVISGKRKFETKVTIVATKASESAIATVQKAGGVIELLPAKVNKLLKPGKVGKKTLRAQAAVAKVEKRAAALAAKK